MRVIIIEDEQASQDYLRHILNTHFPEIEIVALADNVPEAIEVIRKHSPDIVFMDVEIKLGTGFDVLARVGHRTFEVVFITAYNTFAVDAFRHHAIDYLLKPVSAAYMAEAIELCRQRLGNKQRTDQIDKLLRQLQVQPAQKSKIGIHTIEGIEMLDVADIVYGEAKGNYTDLWLKGGAKVTTSKKLKEMEEVLTLHQFFRIHHSYIVNMQYVSKYHKGRGGYLVLQNGLSLPVSSSRKDDFLNWLG